MPQRVETEYGIHLPAVPETPAGADQLATWRNRQLLAIVVAWAVPALALLVTMVLSRLSLRGLAVTSMIVCALSGAAAPGLTVVFLLRRYQARRLAEELPAMPKAILRIS